ncbi:MAG: DUF1295 domain-containing protein [Deltaproteobacteria bacterium]|nr:DUF1295 domain-containing protein [Deltaproteobacteria bacterium]
MALAGVVFVALLFLRAPYGRHAGRAPGPTLPARWGWVLMELPSPVAMAVTFATGRHGGSAVGWALLLPWLAHYAHRTLVQPFRWRGTPTPVPALIVGSGAFFNVINGYTNGRWSFHLGPERGASWLADPRFLVGMLLFIVGEGVNLHADEVLRGLRAPGETGYKIPQGGLYRWVSCPNYLGETVAWWGYALAAWSLPALAFAAWTTANLVPRALAHHRWYRARFPEYPAERRAIAPGLL